MDLTISLVAVLSKHLLAANARSYSPTPVEPSACATLSPWVAEIRHPASVAAHLSVRLKCPITICVAQLAADNRVGEYERALAASKCLLEMPTKEIARFIDLKRVTT